MSTEIPSVSIISTCVADTIVDTVNDTVDDTVDDTVNDTVDDIIADTVDDIVADTNANTISSGLFDDIPDVSTVLQTQSESVEKNGGKKEQMIKEYEDKGKIYAERYRVYMKNAIFQGIRKLSSAHETRECVNLTVHPHDPLYFDINEANGTIEPNENSEKSTFHCVHYGGKHYGKWTKRTLNPLFVNLFRDLQTELFNSKGYYLIDMSDPLKGNKMIIRLFLGKPQFYEKFEPLWHGFGRIPNVHVDVDVDVDVNDDDVNDDKATKAKSTKATKSTKAKATKATKAKAKATGVTGSVDYYDMRLESSDDPQYYQQVMKSKNQRETLD